jgi:DNA-binding MarR family transcriptional regulator
MSDSETEHTAGYLVKRVQQALRRRCDAALRPSGVSMAQYSALRALADHPDATASDLARRCFVTRQSAQELIGGLRAAGLIRQPAGRATGRARPLELTAEGRRRLDAAHRAVMAVDQAMTEGLSTGARRQLASALTRCAANLEAGPTDPT